MASGGAGNFYQEGYFCDYPPAYMLVLGLLGVIGNLLGMSTGSIGFQALMKMVPDCLRPRFGGGLLCGGEEEIRKRRIAGGCRDARAESGVHRHRKLLGAD